MAKHKRSKQLEAGGSSSHYLSTSIPGPPDNDRINVQHPDEGEQKIGEIIIPDTAKEKPQQGKLIAKRPGFDQSSVEVGVQSTSPSVDERRADMRHDRAQDEQWEGYSETLMVPRGDDSWKQEPASSMPAVPAKSQLVGSRIEDLESRYGVKIKVVQGDPAILEAHTSILVRGTGLSVREFTQAVETTISR